ncbi:hypothetical protein PIB30_005154 [Stylosanthes scabra]|uniref:Uncharacterized protein n=1 Tax=Stylosanthes scabra TaxID=79078 RepID=A0ABU6R2R6_9FABA|nr:hypothetical protein [Stylosanthes scabra]
MSDELKVAILAGKKGSSIQRDLTRISQASDTSFPGRKSKLLEVDASFRRGDGEQSYIQLSYEEMSKLFDKEKLVNFDGKEKVSTRSQSAYVFINNDEYKMIDEKKAKKHNEEKSLVIDGFGNEYIVITILVAANGALRLPSINGVADLEKTLGMLRSIRSRYLLAVQMLWTTQKDDDTLSDDELIEDYPQLAKAMGNFKKKE